MLSAETFDRRPKRQRRSHNNIGKIITRITHPATAKAIFKYIRMKITVARDHINLCRSLRL